MKSLPFIVLLLFVNAVNSQIEVMKKPKKDTLFRNKAYGFLNITNVNRTLSPNQDFLPQDIGDRANETPLKTYSFGAFLLHYDEQVIEGPQGKHKLTSKENELIRLLASETNKLVSRSHALKQIWGDDSYFNARSMDVYLSKIRKILKDDPKVQIITVHGEGFKLIVGQA